METGVTVRSLKNKQIQEHGRARDGTCENPTVQVLPYEELKESRHANTNIRRAAMRVIQDGGGNELIYTVIDNTTEIKTIEDIGDVADLKDDEWVHVITSAKQESYTVVTNHSDSDMIGTPIMKSELQPGRKIIEHASDGSSCNNIVNSINVSSHDSSLGNCSGSGRHSMNTNVGFSTTNAQNVKSQLHSQSVFITTIPTLPTTSVVTANNSNALQLKGQFDIQTSNVPSVSKSKVAPVAVAQDICISTSTTNTSSKSAITISHTTNAASSKPKITKLTTHASKFGKLNTKQPIAKATVSLINRSPLKLNSNFRQSAPVATTNVPVIYAKPLQKSNGHAKNIDLISLNSANVSSVKLVNTGVNIRDLPGRQKVIGSTLSNETRFVQSPVQAHTLPLTSTMKTLKPPTIHPIRLKTQAPVVYTVNDRVLEHSKLMLPTKQSTLSMTDFPISNNNNQILVEDSPRESLVQFVDDTSNFVRTNVSLKAAVPNDGNEPDILSNDILSDSLQSSEENDTAPFSAVDQEVLEISKRQLQALEQELLSTSSSKLMQISREDLSSLQDSDGGAEFDLMSNISQGLLFHSTLANNVDVPQCTSASAEANSANSMSIQKESNDHLLESEQLHEAMSADGTRNDTGIAEDTVSSSNDHATISISLDKQKNSTQIQVNTGKEQQIFQLSTDDLAQATAALQPFAISGAMTGVDKDGNVVNSKSVSGITVQDGYLVIPVNHMKNSLEHLPNSEKYDRSRFSGATSGEEELVMSNSFPIDVLKTLSKDELKSKVSKLWVCREPRCNKVYTKSYLLRLHRYTHTDTRMLKCQHPGCEWAFESIHRLKRHQMCHNNNKDFVCTVSGCNRRFTTVYNLNAHVKAHDRPNTIPCNYCGELFANVKAQARHTSEKHKNEPKLISCTEPGCDRKFLTEINRRFHMKAHSGGDDQPYICPFESCKRVFTHKCRLTQHLRTHTGERPFKCSFPGCNWSFATSSKLTRHRKQHTNERRHQCHIAGCGRKYRRQEHLTQHLVSHTGLKPFECKEEGCGAKFAVPSSLYIHLKKHRNGNLKARYNCPYYNCSRKYSSQSRLDEHIAMHGVDAGIPDANVDVVSILNPQNTMSSAAQDTLTALTEASNLAMSRYTAGSGSMEVTPATYQPLVAQELAAADSEHQDSPPVIITTIVPQQSPTHYPVLENTVSHEELIQAAQTATEVEHAAVPLGAAPATQPVITQAAALPGPTSLMMVGNSGAARIDYVSRMSVYDRSRKRHKHSSHKVKHNGYGLGSSKSKRNHHHHSSMNYQREIYTNSTPTAEATSTPHPVVEEGDDENRANSDFDPTSFTGISDIISQGLTVRDPETGASFVQTQLLQDDPPPVLELYNEMTVIDSIDSIGDPSTAPAFLLTDHFITETDIKTEPFSNTTINLQDLA